VTTYYKQIQVHKGDVQQLVLKIIGAKLKKSIDPTNDHQLSDHVTKNPLCMEASLIPWCGVHEKSLVFM
jgi:hypothetical protein